MASWDDSDYDEEVEQKLNEKKLKGSWEDEEDEDEPSPSKAKSSSKKAKGSWDDSEEEEEDAPPPKPKPQPKPQSKAKAKAKNQPAPKAEYQEPLADPKEEKKRLAALVEKREEALASDLFAGLEKPSEKAEEKPEHKKAAEVKKPQGVQVVVKDAFDDYELKTQKDVDEFLATVVAKFTSAKAKDAVPRYLKELLKSLDSLLDLETVQNMEKQMEQFVKAKKAAKTSAQESKTKGNAVTKGTKFNAQDEWSTVYGGGGDDYWDEDEEWDEEGY